MKKVILIDFYDSFTHNIAQCLYDFEIESLIIPWDISIGRLRDILKVHDTNCLVLGPGPGHPIEYEQLFCDIEELLMDENIFIFGICLGHQIIQKILGAAVVPSKNPAHGRSAHTIIPKWKGWFPRDIWDHGLKVQRYNSLCSLPIEGQVIDYWFDQQGEVLGAWGQSYLSYQFHPESIATTGQKFLFSPLPDFIYNYVDGLSDKTQWSLRP